MLSLSPTPSIERLLACLELEKIGPDRYRAHNVETSPGVIYGGQLLAQSIVAGVAGHEGKQAQTVHAVFARSGSTASPVEIEVDPMHAGRTFASSTVSIRQAGRLCARSSLLLSSGEEDFIRHADTGPQSVPPPDPGPGPGPADRADGWQVVLPGDVDIRDPGQVGPPELDVWTRFPEAPEDPGIARALLAYASDSYLIATAMRPHPGVGQAQAHVSLSTGVVSHTLTFHESFSVREWLLMSHRSVHAGHGRAYGRGDVFDTAGALVASFVQDAVIRPIGESSPGSTP